MFCLVVVAWVALFLLFVGFSWVVAFFPFGRYDKKKGQAVGLSSLRGLWVVMQNKVFRPRKIRNRWPLFLRLYIHQSKSIRYRFATA